MSFLKTIYQRNKEVISVWRNLNTIGIEIDKTVINQYIKFPNFIINKCTKTVTINYFSNAFSSSINLPISE